MTEMLRFQRLDINMRSVNQNKQKCNTFLQTLKNLQRFKDQSKDLIKFYQFLYKRSFPQFSISKHEQ
ncbi:MAG: Mlp family lipoprotein [Candidatus Heimdallarchaeota archaeon]|nr:Mlp family lipoprotein [Candidatus Heimdallarchaeota archaeon]